MLSSLIIVFREVLEAALVVGVLLAATRRLPGRGKWVAGGCLLGACGAALTAVFTEAISSAMQGMGQEIFNSIILFSAALLIGWHVVWMKRSAPGLIKELQNVGKRVTEGSAPLYGLAVVSGLAVLREGAEVVLFLYGVLVSGQTWSQVASGGAGGLLLGIVVGAVVYLGLVQVPTKHIFFVTGLILTLLAAGMVSHALGYLTAAGIVPALADPLWDTSKVLAEKSVMGQFLHVLVGYIERPSEMQVIGYIATVGGIFILLKLLDGPPSGPKRKNAAALLIAGIGLLGFCGDAAANKKVYDPYVHKGELEIEYAGSRSIDDRQDKNNQQKHEVSVGYAPADRWSFEVAGEWEREPAVEIPGEDEGEGEWEEGRVHFAATEIENKFQLTEQGEHWLDAGFLVKNEFAAETEGRDELKLMPILQKDWDRWTHIANPFMEYQYGGKESTAAGEGDRDQWVAGASWGTRYRAHPSFEPGVEIFWEYGNVRERKRLDRQEFQAGPAVHGKIGPVKYDIGYLFGVSEESPNGEIKWVVEYEQYF